MAAATFLSGFGSPQGVQAAAAGTNRPASIAGTTNGIFHSPTLNYAVPQTFDGTSINWVTGTFDNAGPITGNWDLNFWASNTATTFDLTAVDDQGDQIAVDAATEVSLLQPGAVIGPALTYKDADQAPSAAWLAGADGYIGFKFNCNGRLANPVAGDGVCYGYVHVITTGTDGFPATVVDYSYDGDGNPISIGPIVTFTVTPSVGTPSGTITPATPQTVNSGSTTSFTLTADAGFHVDTVGGTCNGNLAGNVYTTNAVTADCTVIANFAAGEALPVISATPSPIAISVDAGATQTGTLNVKNTGGGTLTYSISEAAGAAKSTSYLTARRAAHLAKESNASHSSFTQTSSSRSSARAKAGGRAIVLGDLAISQMADNTPGDTGVGCGDNTVGSEGTADNSWWRRFYFSEHAGVGATANIASVTIGGGAGIGPVVAGLPVTINLYTIAHSTAVDTITTSALTLIGTATGAVSGGNVTATIPVIGAVDDTAGKDLVVEIHTEGNAAGEGQFLPAANNTAETHPTFLSSTACGVAEPTPATGVGSGFPNFHMVMIVNVGDGTPPATCDSPTDVPWLSVAPATGSLAGGASADSTVTVDASTLAAGSYSANLCVTSNDTVNPLLTIPVNVTVAAGPVVDPCSAADTIFCNGFDGATPAGDIYDSGDISLAVPANFDGIYINWPDGSNCTDGACGGNLNAYATSSGALHFFWPNNTSDNEAGVGDDDAGTYTILASGATIGPASTFTAAGGSADTSNWQAGVDGFLGFKFACTGPTSGVCYGYVHLTTTAALGFPATIVRYWYDKSGVAITIP